MREILLFVTIQMAIFIIDEIIEKPPWPTGDSPRRKAKRKDNDSLGNRSVLV